ncbi:MAG: hypothetical protein ACOC85_04645 [Thermoplasmatota archaeon]
MGQRLYLYALGIWIILVIMAILNAGLREVVFSRNLGDYLGHVLSSITLSLIIFIVTLLFLKYVNIDYENKDLYYIGVMWLLLTISFEFLFGHFIMGHSWSKLFADYNIFKGRVWILVLISTFISPSLAGKMV